VRPASSDDELPQRIPSPTPHGWFEVLCCGSLVIVLVGGLVLIALLVR
jgi:hypothetical protein